MCAGITQQTPLGVPLQMWVSVSLCSVWNVQHIRCTVPSPSATHLEEAQKLGSRGVHVLRFHVREQRLLGSVAGALDLQELHAGSAAMGWGYVSYVFQTRQL